MSLRKKSLNILLADDSLEITLVASSALERCGHSVAIANDGREALLKIQDKPHHFDLLITDNNMPNLSGVDLIRQIRENGFHGKIIVSSGMITPEMQSFYQTQDIANIVPKPYTMSALCEAVENLDIQQEE